MRISLWVTLTILLVFGVPETALGQSAQASVTITARVIEAPSDPLTKSAVNLVSFPEGQQAGWAVSTGVSDDRYAGYLVRIATRSDDWNRGRYLPAWEPITAGNVVNTDRMLSSGDSGEWFDVTVEHTES